MERDAAFASAFARSGSCIKVVSSDRRDVRFGLESTRWKSSFSFTDDGPLWSSESSQSEESSSSSIALSETSSSSSSDSKTGLCVAALATATSSLKEVCFLLLELPKLLFGRLRLSDSELLYMWLSSELSSSPDEVPIVNIAPFFFGGFDCAKRGEVLRIGVGCAAAARFVCERYDDGAPPGTKPRMMLWVLISVFELLSDPTVFDASSSSTVEVEDSMRVPLDAVREVELAVVVCEGWVVVSSSRWRLERSCEAVVGGSSAGSIEGVGIGISIGSTSSWFCLIEMTMFSRSMGVMCFSRPRLQSARHSSGRAFGIVVVAGADCDSPTSSSSDDVESTLDENERRGMGMLVAAAFGAGIDSGSFEQQNVSRFHSLQLRFSSRFPSSMACDVFENNDHCGGCQYLSHSVQCVELTIPKRFSTDVVSMVCSAGTSTRNNECSGRKGMVVCVCAEGEEAGPRVVWSVTATRVVLSDPAVCVAISDALPSVKAGAELQMPTRVTRLASKWPESRGARDQPRQWAQCSSICRISSARAVVVAGVRYGQRYVWREGCDAELGASRLHKASHARSDMHHRWTHARCTMHVSRPAAFRDREVGLWRSALLSPAFVGGPSG